MASYAIPLTANGTANNHHGHGHTRSQHRRTLFRPNVLQRIDSESISTTPLKTDPFSHNYNPNGHAHVMQHIHHKSHHSNEQIPAALPPASPAFNSVPPGEMQDENILPVAQPSPIKDRFTLTEQSHTGHDSVGHKHSHRQSTSRSIFLKELLTAILIPIPYLLTSLRSLSDTSISDTSSARPTIDQLISSVLEEASKPMPDIPPRPDTLHACAIGSLILLGVGIYGKIISRTGNEGSTRSQAIDKADAGTRDSKLDILRDILAKALSVGLPFYAATKLGGEIIGLSLLLAATSSISLCGYRTNSTVLTWKEGWKRLVKTRPFVSAFLALGSLVDCFASSPVGSGSIMSYCALCLSIFIIPPPFATDAHDSTQPSSVSPLLKSDRDIDSTLLAGFLLGVLVLLHLMTLGALPYDQSELGIVLIAALLGAVSLTFSLPSSLRTPRKIGFVIGSALTVAPSLLSLSPGWSSFIVQSGVTSAAYGAVQLDTGVWLRKHTHHSHHSHHSLSHSHHDSHHHANHAPSAFSKALIRAFRDWPFLHTILIEKESRRIFYFMILNFSFMFVQSTYGFLTHSLGLISDSIHMFFDCLALGVGLCAAVMSKWPSSVRFPYGYGKIDSLAGFANGIFLMIISIEIIYEAIERLTSGMEMHRLDELLIVSVLGLLVNLIGVTNFHHGHDHSHNHEGIYLHMIADLLGSVSVVVSTLMIKYFGWAGFDPLASCVIAGLIFYTSVPLVTSSANNLLMSLPADVEYNLRDTLAGISELRGVGGYKVPKFWLDDGKKVDEHQGHGHGHDHDHHSHDHHSHEHSSHDHPDHGQETQPVFGSMHIIATRVSSLEDVRERAAQYLKGKGMDVVVQVEREGEARCWCGGR